MSTYYHKNKEARLAYQKKYQEEHKEQYNEYQKHYQHIYSKGYAKEYRETHKDRINKQKLESYYRRIAKKEQKEKEQIEKERLKKEKKEKKEVVLYIPEPSPEPIFVGISVGKNGNFVLQW
jgi:hypothetical protein